MAKRVLLGIEAGGTKIICSVANTPKDAAHTVRLSTTTPDRFVADLGVFLRESENQSGPIQAVGIGSFGPANVIPSSPRYGQILTTPKPGWAGFNFVEATMSALGRRVPVIFETDVNAAAVAEATFGAGVGHENVGYVTVGTGIGGGVIHEGRLLHGRIHPEAGHVSVPVSANELAGYESICPFHANCLEGRASGPAIENRWGKPGSELPDNHRAWDLEAEYLAHGCLSLTATWSPDVLVLGGGVMQKPGLIAQVRQHFEALAGGYWQLPPLDEYLVLPKLGQEAGLIGALTLAQQAAGESRR